MITKLTFGHKTTGSWSYSLHLHENCCPMFGVPKPQDSPGLRLCADCEVKMIVHCRCKFVNTHVALQFTQHSLSHKIFICSLHCTSICILTFLSAHETVILRRCILLVGQHNFVKQYHFTFRPIHCQQA